MLIGSMIALGVAAFLAGLWFLHRYYAKATMETALVRTGLGGRKVVVDGGCLALPVVHRLQKVSMQSAAVRVARKGQDALLTSDQMRADIEMDFELRVSPAPQDIAAAAQALGRRIAQSSEGLHDVLTGGFIDAVQNAAASRTLDEIHLNRAEYTRDVQAMVEDRAKRLGLMLVSASLVSVDQSDFSQMNENNAFNAKGMRRLAELVAEERKARVQIETSSEIAVRESRLAQHQRGLELDRTEREADIGQREHIEKLEADSTSRAEQARAEAHMASERARITNERLAKAAQVENDEALRKTEMAAVLALEEEKIANDMRLSKARADEAAVKAAEEESRAQVILAAEGVQAQKDRAVAERERDVAAFRQKRELELEAARAKSDAETLLTKTNAETEAAASEAKAGRVRMEAEAAGREAMIMAENKLEDSVIRMRLEERKLDKLPEIMTQMMKPVEKIESIRINHIGGSGLGGSEGAKGGSDNAFGAAMDQILGMAVRLPAMKQMGEDIGLDFDAQTAGRTADYANRIKDKDGKDNKEKG